MKKKRPLSALRRDLDKLFSLFIRRRDALPNGMGRCFTCNRYSLLEAGHFIRRQHVATRWDERNVHGQCAYCNRWQHGAQAEYYVELVKKYGQATVDELMQLKRTPTRFNRDDYEKMLERFR